MTNSKKRTISTRIKDIYWHISRYDKKRAVIASRAAIVLSADSILLAAATLLLDKSLSPEILNNIDEKIIFVIAIGLTLLLLAISIFFSAQAIANIWKVSRKLFKIGKEVKRDFFHTRDTLEHSPNFETFKKKFQELSEEDIEQYALGELYTLTISQLYRYDKLQKAIRCTIYSILPLFIAILVILIKTVVVK